jgi:16S rRNA C967 or C1407 C5-methylase (RsmB/RsmF family)
MEESKHRKLVAVLQHDLAQLKQKGISLRLKRVERRYLELCAYPSDINEHLPTLYGYAQQCSSVFETGVRGVVSTWALALGILSNPATERRIHLLNDIHPCELSEVDRAMEGLGISVERQWLSNLDLRFSEHTTFDLTFIDTWHVYGQLRRELAKFAPITNKYIILHDTEGDGIDGETIRLGGDAHRQSKATGIPVDEILKGLQPAVDEFLEQNSEDWALKECFTNNNGLTILERKRQLGRTAGNAPLMLAPQAALESSEFQCRACRECFASRNRLFSHIAQTGHEAHTSGLKDQQAPPARATMGTGAKLYHDYYQQVLRSGCGAEEWEAVYRRFMTALPQSVCTYPASSLGSLAGTLLRAHRGGTGAAMGAMGDELTDALQELGGLDETDVCSMLPALLLEVQPDQCVLDLCSSTKTLQLLNTIMAPRAARTSNSAADDTATLGVGADADGCLVSNNHDFARQTTLLRKTRSFSASCYSPLRPSSSVGQAASNSTTSATAALLLLAEDAAHLPCVRKANSWKVEFDRVLVHVPSSGDGAHRPMPSKLGSGGGDEGSSSSGVGLEGEDSNQQRTAATMVAEWHNWSAAAGLKHHGLQVKILVRGLQLLGKGKQHTKRLVYSTHSLNPLENEAVVAAALAIVNSSQGDEANDARRSELRLVPVLPLPADMEQEIMRLANGLEVAKEGAGARLGSDWLPGLTSWEVPSPKWRDKRREKQAEAKGGGGKDKGEPEVRQYARAADVPKRLKRVVKDSMFPPADEAVASQLQLCRRVLPTHAHCDGHGLFIALFEKMLPGEDAPAHTDAVAIVRTASAEDRGKKDKKEKKGKKGTKVEMRPVFEAPTAVGASCVHAVEQFCSYFGLATTLEAAAEAGVQRFPLEGVRYYRRVQQLVLVSRQLSTLGEPCARPLKIVEGGLQLFSFTDPSTAASSGGGGGGDGGGGEGGWTPFESAAPIFAVSATKRVLTFVMEADGAFTALDLLLAERGLGRERVFGLHHKGLLQGLHSCSTDSGAGTDADRWQCEPGAVIVTANARMKATGESEATSCPLLSVCLVCKLTAQGELQLLTPSYSAAHWQVLLASANPSLAKSRSSTPYGHPTRALATGPAMRKPVAICFYGLTRSLRWTLPSIEKCIFGALDEQHVEYVVYTHTFTLPGDALTNARTGESGEKLDRDEWRSLCYETQGGSSNGSSRGVRQAKHVVESQGAYLEGEGLRLVQEGGSTEGAEGADGGRGLQSYLRHGDHWHDGGQSVLNLLCQLRSLKRVTELWDEADHDVAIYVRPDLRYLTPIRLDELDRCRAEKCVLMPTWQTYNGCNDRLCIGHAQPMKHVYGSRGDRAHSYAQKERLHAEGFLRHCLEESSVPWGATSMRAQRVRANGKTDPKDVNLAD